MQEQPGRIVRWGRSLWQRVRRVWRSFGRWFDHWLWSPCIRFIRALPLLLLWLSIPGAVLCISTYYQSGISARELADRSPVWTTREIPDSAAGPLILSITHPRKLLVESSEEASVPLAVWLIRATPMPEPTIMPTSSFTLTVTPTPPPLSEPTAMPAPPYVVAFTQSGGLMFTDEEGYPARSEIALTPAPFPATPALLHIRAAQPPEASLPPKVNLEVRVSGPGMAPMQAHTTVEVESVWESRWRRWGNALTGTSALIVALTTALVGFGVQQWRQMAEEEQKRQEEQRTVALQDIERLGTLIEANLSKGARRYIEYQARREQGWAFTEIQDRLGEKWNNIAPDQLRLTVNLTRASEQERSTIIKEVGIEQVQNSLWWCWRRLDKEWQRQIVDLLLVMTPTYQFTFPELVEQRLWKSMLRVWTDLALWPPFKPRMGGEVEHGLQVLGLSTSPFGPGRAEEDTLLIPCRVNLPVMERLRTPKPALVVGPSGSGKTATALLFVLDALRKRDTFPVYWRSSSTKLVSMRVANVAQAIAQTLLSHMAVEPTAFREHEIEGKAAIAHLVARYLGTGADLALRFYQAGLPQVGTGHQVMEEIGALVRDVSFDTSIGEDELLMLLAEARLYGFPHTTVLLDVQTDDAQGRTVSNACLSSFLGLLTTLERRGVFVKAFLPAEAFEEPLQRLGEGVTVEQIRLAWSPDELRQMLSNRLALFDYDSLVQWCVPGGVDLKPDERLVKRAAGSPRRLVELGNALLQRIGRTGSKLTAYGLNQALRVKR